MFANITLFLYEFYPVYQNYINGVGNYLFGETKKRSIKTISFKRDYILAS